MAGVHRAAALAVEAENDVVGVEAFGGEPVGLDLDQRGVLGIPGLRGVNRSEAEVTGENHLRGAIPLALRGVSGECLDLLLLTTERAAGKGC
jgi:hypothetical protein